MAIKTVGVLGCGLMGSGITQVSAQAGFPTVVVEANQALLDRGLDGLKKTLEGLVAKAKIQAKDRDATPGRLTGTTRPGDLKARGLVGVGGGEGQGAGGYQGRDRLHREPTAGAVPPRRGPRVRVGARLARGHRSGHEARVRIPHGALHAPGPGGAGHDDVRGRGDVRGVPRAALRAAAAPEAHGHGRPPPAEERAWLLRLRQALMQQLYYLTDEQRAVRDLVREIAREKIAPVAAYYDETESYPEEIMKLLAQQGLMGIWVPEAYGGTNMGALAVSLVAEELAWACAATATNW